ncbi:hypothetical protein KCU93_g286, partial [Aureobasidium melanogenum]
MICVGKAENLEIRAIVPIVRDRDKMRHTSKVRDQQRDLERLKNVGETTVDMYSFYTHQSLLDRWLRDIASSLFRKMPDALESGQILQTKVSSS